MSNNATEMVESVEMSAEESKAEIRTYEDDILSGLIAAAGYKTDEENKVKIEIKRGNAIVIAFRIRPLSEEEYTQCKKRNTNYKRNKGSGIKVAESVNAARYRSELIYTATIEEDRDKIWGNRKAWDKLNVVNGIDLIDVVLKAGEKDAILVKLDEISGFEPSMEDVAKN